nr:MAG TPA: hypothetical protein [Caudoviricetes sp.]
MLIFQGFEGYCIIVFFYCNNKFLFTQSLNNR